MKLLEVENFFEIHYGKGVEATLPIDGKEIEGIMYGNDECWDGDTFYQIFVVVDDDIITIYKAYYDTGTRDWDNEEYVGLDEIDYDNPDWTDDVTSIYEFVI